MTSLAIAVCSWSAIAWTIKKLDLLIIQIAMPAQRVNMLRGVATDHGFVHQRGGSVFRRGTEQHAMNRFAGVRQAFEDGSGFFEVLVLQADGDPNFFARSG
jgi:hypothetical protein